MDRPALAIVIPAGPSDDIADTLASVIEYTKAPRFIVVIDDGATSEKATLEALSQDVRVIQALPLPHGTLGTLWTKLAAGYRYVLENFHFDILLRLDADALIIGDGIAEATAERFDKNGQIGLLGSYRVGPDGHIRDWTEAATVLARECGLRGMDRPLMRRFLRTVRSEAIANGYIAGEQVLGGAYLHSRAAVLALADRGWLMPSPLRYSHLGEDQLVALLTVAAGYRLADFGGPDDPLALKWKGLPAPPTDLLARNKLITHSVRYCENMGEREIRAIFSSARQARNLEPQQGVKLERPR